MGLVSIICFHIIVSEAPQSSFKHSGSWDIFVIMFLLYRVSTMERPDFGDVLKIGRWSFFQVLRVSCVLQYFKFLVCCVTDILSIIRQYLYSSLSENTTHVSV